jgi:hypothetical protein
MINRARLRPFLLLVTALLLTWLLLLASGLTVGVRGLTLRAAAAAPPIPETPTTIQIVAASPALQIAPVGREQVGQPLPLPPGNVEVDTLSATRPSDGARLTIDVVTRKAAGREQRSQVLVYDSDAARIANKPVAIGDFRYAGDPRGILSARAGAGDSTLVLSIEASEGDGDVNDTSLLYLVTDYPISVSGTVEITREITHIYPVRRDMPLVVLEPTSPAVPTPKMDGQP